MRTTPTKPEPAHDIEKCLDCGIELNADNRYGRFCTDCKIKRVLATDGEKMGRYATMARW